MIKDRRKRHDNSCQEQSYKLNSVLSVGSAGQNCLKAYCWAVYCFMPCVVGSTKWKSNYLMLPISEFVDETGTSVEAFACLDTITHSIVIPFTLS